MNQHEHSIKKINNNILKSLGIFIVNTKNKTIAQYIKTADRFIDFKSYTKRKTIMIITESSYSI